MGKNNKKNPFAGKRLPNQSNPAKASKLPGKKPKPTSSSTNNNRDGSSGSKRSKRSVLGYLVGVGVSVVVWGWSVYQHAVKLSRDKDTLTNMRRKPLYYTEVRTLIKHTPQIYVFTIAKNKRFCSFHLFIVSRFNLIPAACCVSYGLSLRL